MKKITKVKPCESLQSLNDFQFKNTPKNSDNLFYVRKSAFKCCC